MEESGGGSFLLCFPLVPFVLLRSSRALNSHPTPLPVDGSFRAPEMQVGGLVAQGPLAGFGDSSVTLSLGWGTLGAQGQLLGGCSGCLLLSLMISLSLCPQTLVAQCSLAGFGDSSVTLSSVQSQAWGTWGAEGKLLGVCSGCVLLSAVSDVSLCPQTIEFDESAGAVLRIQPLRTPRDENIYECVAQNPHGEVTVHAKLTVLRGKEPAQCHGKGPQVGGEAAQSPWLRHKALLGLVWCGLF